MLPLKSSYQKKLDELGLQIEEKAKELTHVRNEVERETARRQTLLADIKSLEDKRTTLLYSIAVGDSQRQEESQTWQEKAASFDRQTFVKQRELKALDDKISQKNQELRELENEKNDVRKMNARLPNEQKALTKLESQKQKIFLEVKSLAEKRDKEEKVIQEVRDNAENLLAQAEEIVKDAQETRNALKPYVNEISKWYKLRGEEVPKLIQDWKPKHLIVSLHQFKKIKGKLNQL